MIFGTKRRLSHIVDMPIFISGDPIERMTEFEHLGVYLDQCVTFEKHNKDIDSKASSKMGVIRKIKRVYRSTN